KPGLYEAELNLGILLLRQKQGGAAVPYLQQAVEQKPKEFRPRYFLAEALLASGDFAKAEESYRVAQELDPKSAATELGWARAIARQNRLEEAAPHFRKAAELDPSFKDALLELAELYEKNKMTVEAIELYKQFPDNVAAKERMANLMLDTKRYQEAIPELEVAVQKDPTPANRLALAEAYLFNKQLDKALPLIEKSVAEQPSDYNLRMMYGRALRDHKQYREAAQQFYQGTKLKPDSREAWNELAGMLYLVEAYQQALAALDKARELGENTPANYYFRAITLDKMHVVEPALQNYEKFLELSQGKNPDEEFKARQRARILKRELSKR
ncbi:MAG TPA: tetratricopeptide repeat protein, partial [Bryobacteraceae bacterium]|nr:tetratricopeptide repeat protein [Bryobacteraceae bacterium]